MDFFSVLKIIIPVINNISKETQTVPNDNVATNKAATIKPNNKYMVGSPSLYNGKISAK